MTPAELERWVFLASNVTSDQQPRWEATNLLNAWSQSKDPAVTRCLLNVLQTSKEESVLFYALTTLQRLSLQLEERVELRNFLLTFDYNVVLKTKAAVVLALLIKTDFPLQWPRAFDELRRMASAEIFLRTLATLMEDVLMNADSDATRVKDAMRGLGQPPLQKTVAAQIMDSLVELLASSFSSPSQVDNAQLICSLSFEVLKRLVSWIDVALVLEDRVLSLIFCGVELEQKNIAVPAVETLQELVGRGMADEKKIDLLQRVDLLKRIHDSRVNLDTVDASPIEIVIEVAKLINATGLELLSLWDDAADQQQSDALNTLLQQLLDLFFRCFAYDDIDVSGAVIPLASRLTVTLGKEENKTSKSFNIPANGHLFRVAPHLPQLLTVMFRQMRYPPDFEFDYQDEDEAEEEVYRTELRKLNQCCVRIRPDLCLQFLCEALSNLPVPISSCATSDIEASLRLIYHYCEGIRPPPGTKVVMRNETFRAVLVALHGSDIASHPHREVLLLYYDICVRYHGIFKDNPQLLPSVLGSLSGVQGLQHSHERVRSRSCYLLLRLVKSLASVLRPYVETAVMGIQSKALLVC